MTDSILPDDRSQAIWSLYPFKIICHPILQGTAEETTDYRNNLVMSRSRSFLIPIILIAGCTFTARIAASQQLKLGNNPTVINKAAILEMEASNQGMRLPRADTAAINTVISTLSAEQRDSCVGMITFQLIDSSLYIRKNGYWDRLVIDDSLGIVSVNGDKSHDQTLSLANHPGALGFTAPAPGIHTLNIPLASVTDTGVITPGDQEINGTKTLVRSPIIKTLHSGSVVFLGSNDSLSEDNANLLWDIIHKRLGIGTSLPTNSLDVKSVSTGTSGLTLSNLPSSISVTDQSAEAIGVNSTGEVVRVNTTPTYYNSNGDVLTPQIKKIVVDSITSTASSQVSETRTIDVSAVGFTKILSIQLTGKITINDTTNDKLYSIIPSILDYNTSQVSIRVLELQIGNPSLLGGVVGNLAGNAFQVPSKNVSVLGLGLIQLNDPKPYTIYYRIEGY